MDTVEAIYQEVSIGIPIEFVLFIESIDNVKKLPSVHPSILGYIGFHNQHIPVVDLMVLNGAKNTNDKSAMYRSIVICSHNQKAIAIAVDRIVTIKNIQTVPMLGQKDLWCLSSLNAQPWNILNVPFLFEYIAPTATHLKIDKIEHNNDHEVLYLGCRVGEKDIAFSMDNIRYVQRYDHTPAQTQSQSIIGYTEYQQQKIPIISMSSIWKIPAENVHYIVLVEHKNVLIALAANHVIQLRQFKENDTNLHALHVDNKVYPKIDMEWLYTHFGYTPTRTSEDKNNEILQTMNTYAVMDIMGSKYALEIESVEQALEIMDTEIIHYKHRILQIQSLRPHHDKNTDAQFALVCNINEHWTAVRINLLLGSHKGTLVGHDQQFIKTTNGDLCGNLKKILLKNKNLSNLSVENASGVIL